MKPRRAQRRPGAATRLVRVAASLGFPALAVGCSDPAPTSRPTDAGTRAESSVVDAPKDVELPPCEPTFDSIQRNVFDIACGEGTCHGPPTPAWELVLTDGPRAADRLIGKVAASCPEFFRVVPGKPSESFLWLKVSSSHPPCGDPMPFGGPPLPEWSRKCIHDWISGLTTPSDGAPD